MRTKKLIIWAVVITAVGCNPVFAAHPLITDDALTIKKGNFELEVNGEYENESHGGVKEKEVEVETGITYGITDTANIGIAFPYYYWKTKDETGTSHAEGISDMAVKMKWRIYQQDSLSLALKPEITIPTGDKDKDLGYGWASYSLLFLATETIAPWAFHMNMGYIYNGRSEEDVPVKRELYHVSAAAEYEVLKDLKLVADIGVERTFVDHVKNEPPFILTGFIYTVSELLDVDAGYKRSIGNHGREEYFMAGIKLKF